MIQSGKLINNKKIKINKVYIIKRFVCFIQVINTKIGTVAQN